MVHAIIGDGARLGYRHLHLTGGEPLLWDGLFETLERAFHAGYRHVLINTNGTLLSRPICRRLSGHEGLSVSVSLEVSKTLHEMIRGYNTHERTLRGVQNALEAGIPLVLFSMVGHSALPQIPAFADELSRRFPDLKSLTFIQLCNFSDGFFPLSQELLTPAEYVRFVQTVSLLNLFGFSVDILNDPLVNVVATRLHMPWIPWVRPLIHPGSLIVRANKAIGLCHSAPGQLGEFTPGAIGKILLSDTYKRCIAPDDTTCPSCSYVGICRENGMIRPSRCSGNSAREGLFCKGVMAEISQ
jgi:sulfatase maturation enzyme AslB (radical SAM superfamily)